MKTNGIEVNIVSVSSGSRLSTKKVKGVKESKIQSDAASNIINHQSIL